MIFSTKLFTFWLFSLNLHVRAEVNGKTVSRTEVDSWEKMILYRKSIVSPVSPKEGPGREITSLSLLFEEHMANKRKCPYCRLRCATLRRVIQDELKSSVMNASSGLPLPTVKIASNKELDDKILRIELYNVRNVSATAKCTLVIFYAPWCQWSAKAAPHLNAVSRAFKNIQFVGVDAYSSSSFDISNYGVYGVPSLLLFHNGRLHTRYNGSDITMHSVANFLTRHTDQIPGEMEMKSVDFRGPLRSKPVPSSFSRKELLMGSWLFIIASAMYYLLKWEIFFKIFLKLWLLAQSNMEDEEFRELKRDNNLVYSSMSIFRNNL